MKNSILLFLMLTGYFLTGQDLTITSLTGNKSIFRYEMFQTNAIIENKGAQTVDISTAINFFFSSDDILDGSDVFIGSTITDPLAVGESRSETLSISSRVPAGLYYLIAVADGETQINESNETNNTLAIGGYIINESDVDFTFIDVSLSTDIIENGSSFDITFHAKNQGPTNVDGTVSVGFYLSTDNVISIDDLGIVWNNESWMGSDHSVTLTTAIPWAQPGNYYIIGFVEDGGPCCGYDETDKDNNYWYLPFVITPADIDLEIVSPLMVTVSDSQYLSATFDLTNHGSTSITQYEFEVALSTDTELDYPGDYQVYVSGWNTAPIKNGEVAQISLSGYLNEITPPGDYYVIIHVNHSHSLDETDYTNNEKASDLITFDQPWVKSIEISSPAFLTPYDVTDTQITLVFDLTNNGNNYNVDQMYSIIVTDADNTIVISSEQNEALSIPPGTTNHGLKWHIDMVNTLPAGHYTVSVNCQEGTECYTNAFSLPLIIMDLQSIQFNEIADKTFTDDPFDAGAAATSELPVELSSSNPSVAVIENGLIKIVGIGEVTITASQPGNLEFRPAQSVSRSFEIRNAQNIEFAEIADKTFVDEPFDAGATATSGLPVELMSSDLSVAVIENGLIKIVGVGEVSFTASQPGNEQFWPAQNVVRTFNIFKGAQTITFTEIETRDMDDLDFELSATASSGLPVSYFSDNANVATIEGNFVLIKGVGISQITAEQTGDEHFLPAEPVVRTLTITVVAGIPGRIDRAYAYPNPATEFIMINNMESQISEVVVIDANGKSLSALFNDRRIDVRTLAPGAYFLKVIDSAGVSHTFRIIKEQ